MRGNVQARFWSGGGGGDVFAYRNHTGAGLAMLTLRQRAYSYRHTERFLAQVARAGGDAALTDALAAWTATCLPMCSAGARPATTGLLPRWAQETGGAP